MGFFRLLILQSIVLVVLLFPAPADSGTLQATSPPPGKYLINIENIPSPAYGLVFTILRDKRGFLWFGTTHGLQKYDGYSVKVYEIPAQKFEGPSVTSMIEYGDSLILLATRRGLWTFNFKTEQFNPFLPNIEFGDGRIGALLQDGLGKLWIGTRTAGLFCYDPATKAVRRYTGNDGLSDSTVVQVIVDHSGIVWIATHHGLNSFIPETGRFVQYHSNPLDKHTLSSDEIEVIHEDAAGELWIGTTKGLQKFDRRTGSMQRVDVAVGELSDVKAITHDAAGIIWIGIAGAGLFSYEHGSLTQLAPSGGNGQKISDPFIVTLYVDPSSTANDLLMWVGTRGGGVDEVRMTKNPFACFTRNQNLPIRGNGAILTLSENKSGTLWVGLWGGGLDALRYEDGSYKFVAHYMNNSREPFSLPDNSVNAIAFDHDGHNWIGTNRGLAEFHPGTQRFTVYLHAADDSLSIAGNLVGKIFEDSRGRLWICTDGGLSELIRGTPNRFKNWLNRREDAHSLGRFSGGNLISDIVEDHSGNLWVSMYGGGVNMLGPNGQYTRFLNPIDVERTRQNWIYNLHEDQNGIFWLSTDGGLLTFDPASGTFSSVPSKDLHDAHINDITHDDNGMIWLSTGIGLVRYDPRTVTFKRYDESQGLPFRELMSEFYRAGTKMYFGGLDGLCAFYPDSMKTTSAAPSIVITGFSIFDNPMPATFFSAPEIDLRHDQNFFSFSFAALDYGNALRNRYLYRMNGVDVDWVNAGNRNYASYTNLDPGSYTFQVKGAGSENVWNESGTSVVITITPPYWQTWWFRFFAAITVAGITYSLYRYRFKTIVELERLRLRIANDLHDDVGSNLSAIALASRSAERSPELSEPTRLKLREIYEIAVQTSKDMKDLVWFVRPENDTLEDLLEQMKDTAAGLLGEMNVEFHFPRGGESDSIGIDFKRNVFLAYKEIVTNVAKHSNATRVEIDAKVRDRMFELIVLDNGKGFDARSSHRGNGLKNLQKRAQLVGGTCSVSSVPQGGTTVSFTARL